MSKDKNGMPENGQEQRVKDYKKFINRQLERCKDEEALCFVANYLFQIDYDNGSIPEGE